ncbi:MAG: hypothetical protein IIC95_09910 [Chloroflexi bacterium]|nr:hypothetical protein [Chloroflexota bacterium]
MRVWLTGEDGTYIDETDVEKMPSAGDEIVVGSRWRVVETPPQDENAKRTGAHVLVVRPAE